MNKKLLIGLALFSLFFFGGGGGASFMKTVKTNSTIEQKKCKGHEKRDWRLSFKNGI